MSPEPKSAADLLGSVLESVQSKSSRAVFERALRDVLGSDTSDQCTVRNFHRGTLYIEIASAPLFAELSSFRREAIRDGINERLKDQRVAKIVFRMDGTGHV